MCRGRHRVRTLADSPDDGSFGDLVAAHDVGRAQLQQRDRVTVRRLDRDRTPAARNRAGERNGAGSRRAHGGPDLGADVDAAVLATCVRVVAERERAQDRPVTRPRPGLCGRRDGERRQDDRGNQLSPHRKPPSVVVESNSGHASRGCQRLFNDSE